MEFFIENDCFKKAVLEVSNVVSHKASLPVLTGIKIVAEKENIILVGSNSDIIIEKLIPIEINSNRVVEVLKGGNTVLPAKYVSELTKKLTGKLHFMLDESNHVSIQSNEKKTTLKGSSGENYPKIPEMIDSEYITLGSDELLQMMKQTVFAASKSETRPVLTGVNMSFKEKLLICVATNSQRLAMKRFTVKQNIEGSFTVPSSSIHELSKLLSQNNEEVKVYYSNNYVIFKTNDFTLYSRLIEGNYPDTARLIPKEATTEILVNTHQFLKGIDRALLFASEWRNHNVHIELFDNGKLKISSNSDKGKIEEIQTVKIRKGASNFRVTLDGKFLLDVLRVIKEEEIIISFGGTMKPILIRPLNNSSYVHLISPVRTY